MSEFYLACKRETIQGQILFYNQRFEKGTQLLVPSVSILKLKF